MTNPFTIISPEKLDAKLAKQLFVEVYSDFPQVKNPGHSLILGARGSGKSMIIRCLLPDVLMLTSDCSFDDLEFVAFHVPIKNTNLKITELDVLEKHHASFMINEHFMIINLMMQIFDALSKFDNIIQYDSDSYNEFLKIYNRRLKLQGCASQAEVQCEDASGFFRVLYEHFEELHAEFTLFLRNATNVDDPTLLRYDLPILSYMGFAVPVLLALQSLPGFNKNMYLFFDDADNLSKTQTRILNSWLASRTTPKICLKVSTQIGKYKSFVTTNGTLVESPHDFQEINISEKYTTNKNHYYERIYHIVKKRLSLAGIESVSPEEFFPVYEPQEKAIENEKKRLIELWNKGEGRGNRANDDAQRYARPNYILSLGGTRKQRSKYMYAGFETLVHLSSGVIRLFLDSAAAMFDLEASNNEKGTVNFISYTSQNRVARDKADEFLYSQFKRLEKDEDVLTGDLDNIQKLQNLIFSMGKTFHDILVCSERAERRVFSIALTNIPTPEIKEVLELGVQTGYLHNASIGTKDGSGRTPLYILNRYLSPHFTLDPTSFAGYQFVTNNSIIAAMNTGAKIKDVKNEDCRDDMQLSLFDYFNEEV